VPVDCILVIDAMPWVICIEPIDAGVRAACMLMPCWMAQSMAYTCATLAFGRAAPGSGASRAIKMRSVIFATCGAYAAMPSMTSAPDIPASVWRSASPCACV
jgi:hypothetical protein